MYKFMDQEKEYQNKTILQVVPALVSGGIERGTLEIAKALVQHGYKSIVLSSGGPLVKQLVENGSIHIQCDVATKNPLRIWKNAKKIIEIVKEHNVDIIHARSRAPAWSCGLAAKSTGTKFITTFHGIYNFNNIIKKRYNSIMTDGDIVIAVSDFVKKHIINNYEVDSNKIKVIHRGVNHREFSLQNLEQQKLDSIRVKYKVPANTPVLLLPARFTSWKGHMQLLEALELIKDSNFYCILAGDLAKHPNFVQRVKDRIFSNKMQAKVQIFGNEPDIKSLYGIADIVLSTSIEPEAFGRTIIEAQAMERLVIASGIGGAAETIENGVTGYHYNPNDPSELAKLIKQCLDMLGTDQAKEMASKARESAIGKFSLDNMISKVLKEVYENI